MLSRSKAYHVGQQSRNYWPRYWAQKREEKKAAATEKAIKAFLCVDLGHESVEEIQRHPPIKHAYCKQQVSASSNNLGHIL